MTNKSVSIWGTRSDETRDNHSFFSKTSGASRREEGPPASATSKQHVAGMRDKLGLWDKVALDRQSKNEARRVIGELVVNLLEKQKQEILFKMPLELADEKKRAFADSMREGSLIEREIAERSTEFERDLIDLALDYGIDYHEQKKTRLDRLESKRATGKIDEESYALERESVERWARIFRDNLDAKVEIILRNHAQQIEKALALFQERAISGRFD